MATEITYKYNRETTRRERKVANIRALYRHDKRVTLNYCGVYHDIHRVITENKEMADLWVGITGQTFVTTRHGSKAYRRLTDAIRAFEKIIA